MMRHVFCLLIGCAATLHARVGCAQELQLHYDWRHATDPRTNARNFPSLTFKTFKTLEFGSFLLKLEADLDGTRHDVSKGYMEISQTMRWWKAPIYALAEYSGGLGLYEGATGGFYLENGYHLGVAYPFAWRGGFASASLAYKFSNLPRPSHDPQATLYWGRPFGQRWTFASTGVFWSQNRNRGDDDTSSLTGKRRSLLIENELWWRAATLISVGSEVRVSRNVYANDGRLLVYPTLGLRYRF